MGLLHVYCCRHRDDRNWTVATHWWPSRSLILARSNSVQVRQSVTLMQFCSITFVAVSMPRNSVLTEASHECARLLVRSIQTLKSVRRATPLTAALASESGDDCDTVPRAAAHRQQLRGLCLSAPIPSPFWAGGHLDASCRGDEVSLSKSNRWSHRCCGRSVTRSGQIMARRQSTSV